MHDLILKFESEAAKDEMATSILEGFDESDAENGPNRAERVGDTIFFTRQADPKNTQVQLEEEAGGAAEVDESGSTVVEVKPSVTDSEEPAPSGNEDANGDESAVDTEEADTVDEVDAEAVGSGKVAIEGNPEKVEEIVGDDVPKAEFPLEGEPVQPAEAVPEAPTGVTAGTGEFEQVPEGTTVVDSSAVDSEVVPADSEEATEPVADSGAEQDTLDHLEDIRKAVEREIEEEKAERERG